MSNHIFGLEIIEVDYLPLIPDHCEDVRRVMRHRMAELAPWLNFDRGPTPGAEAHAEVSHVDRVVYVSPQLYEIIMRWDRGAYQIPAEARAIWDARRASGLSRQEEAAYLPGDRHAQALDHGRRVMSEGALYRTYMREFNEQIRRKLEEYQTYYSAYALPRRFIVGGSPT